jgi:hypothetical protein
MMTFLLLGILAVLGFLCFIGPDVIDPGRCR